MSGSSRERLKSIMHKIKDIFTAHKRRPRKPNNSVYVISEIGINHQGSLDTALRLIEVSKKAGADAVKFQKRNLAEIYTEEILNDHTSAEWNLDYLIPLLKEVELSEDEYFIIYNKCRELDIELIVTRFDVMSAEFCSLLDVAAFKIGSMDMVNLPLIEKCASYEKPLIVSTGMWGNIDIKKTVREFDFDFALLLANSTYPTPYEEINLKYIRQLLWWTDVVGYSGHERGIAIPIAAIGMGARIIEKHITFDKTQKGPDHKASLLPEEFTEMVKQIRTLEKALGNGNKKVNQAEKLNKEAFASCAVAKRDLEAGSLLSEGDYIFRSPGKGIFPHEIREFVGDVLRRDVKKGKPIAKSHFKEELKIKDWEKFSFNKSWGVKCRFHDFEEYKQVNSPVIEFHCSDSDLNIDFKGETKNSKLIVHAPEIVDRELVDLCSRDDRIVKQSLDVLEHSINKTLQIAPKFMGEKPKVVIHLGGMSLEPIDGKLLDISSSMIDRAIKNFAPLWERYCEKVDLLPENLPPRPWYIGGEWFQYGFMSTFDMRRFCDVFNLGMTYDMCHAALYCNDVGISLLDYTRSVKNIVSHVHISDAVGINGEGHQIHEGCINFEDIFTELSDVDYTWVTEIWSGHLHSGLGVHRSLKELKKYKNLL